jgi:hypothetical protein
LEAFGLGYWSEPSHDYAGSSLFNKEYYDRREELRDRREQISYKKIAIKIADKIVRQKPTTPQDLQLVVTRDAVLVTRDIVVVTRDTVVVTRDAVVVTRDTVIVTRDI